MQDNGNSKDLYAVITFGPVAGGNDTFYFLAADTSNPPIGSLGYPVRVFENLPPDGMTWIWKVEHQQFDDNTFTLVGSKYEGLGMYITPDSQVYLRQLPPSDRTLILHSFTPTDKHHYTGTVTVKSRTKKLYVLPGGTLTAQSLNYIDPDGLGTDQATILFYHI